MRQRRGFTLVETLIAIAIAGLVCLIGFPKLTTAMRKANARSARNTLITMYSRSRAAAVESGRTVTLHFSSTTGYATASPRLNALAGSTVDTVVPPLNFSTQYGATLSPQPTDITIDGRGFGSTAGYTMYATNGSAKDSMVISGFGMVAK
jgi:prepilin-type N-terminal cleavage/methylation domain-containing protein